MATSADPIFATGFDTFVGKATAAKTTFTDATNAVLMLTAGAEGALVTSCLARALATLSGATVYYCFISRDAGTTLALKAAILVSADTVSTTDAPLATDMGPSEDAPWKLGPGDILYCAISVANATGVQFVGEYEDFEA